VRLTLVILLLLALAILRLLTLVVLLLRISLVLHIHLAIWHWHYTPMVMNFPLFLYQRARRTKRVDTKVANLITSYIVGCSNFTSINTTSTWKAT
jgi:hypothetical protein